MQHQVFFPLLSPRYDRRRSELPSSAAPSARPLVFPCDYCKLLMEASDSYCNAANACHGNEMFRLDGEQDRENPFSCCCECGLI